MNVRTVFSSTRTKVAAGVLAATLTLGGGAAVVGAQALAGPGTPAAGTPTTSQPATQNRCTVFNARLAQNLGISPAALVSAEKTTLNQLIDARQQAGKITAAQAQKLHDRVNNSKGACGIGARARTKARAAVGAVRKSELQAVAAELKISPQDLAQQLQGGQSLAQIAAAHNASADQLKATMRTALQTDLDQAVKNGKITQDQENKALAAFDQHIDTIINRQHQPKQQSQ
ncbi:MAG: hypothetical protein ACTHMR_07170 [Thermomicrobiales bacterium]